MRWLVNDDPLFVLPTVAVRLGLNESIFCSSFIIGSGKVRIRMTGMCGYITRTKGGKSSFRFGRKARFGARSFGLRKRHRRIKVSLQA